MSVEVVTNPESLLSEAGIKLQDTAREMTKEFVALCAAHSRDKSIPADVARTEVIGTIISGAAHLLIDIANLIAGDDDDDICGLCQAGEHIREAAHQIAKIEPHTVQ
jgi:hypothetical protein